MYSEEETELRDIIMQNLENCGFLNKIKAELRAGVFLALEEDGNLKNKFPVLNTKIDNFISSLEGKLAVSLVREFLDYFNLHFTLSVFEPEIASSVSFLCHSDLCDQLNVKTENDEPVLITLLKSVGVKKQSNQSLDEYNASHKPVKTTLNKTALDKITLDDHINHGNIDHMKNIQNLKIDSVITAEEDLKSTFNNAGILPVDVSKGESISDVLKEKDSQIEKDNKSSTVKESTNLLPLEHDPFFDEPLPSEKTTFFKLSESSKDKSENISIISSNKDFGENKNSSLTSLRDLPSLTASASHEWTFNRDVKNALPSLDSLKSVSSSEASNEEVINLDPKDIFEKKKSNFEESSEKQNSEESIEEEIEDDFSAGYDDLLNSSLSLADDVTTDQTISQVSIVEGVDHVEPCK